MKKARKKASVNLKWAKRLMAVRYRDIIKGSCVFLVAWALTVVLMCLAVAPTQYSITVNEPAQETIRASKDIEDKLTTEQERQAAMDKVENIYVLDTASIEASLAGVQSAYDALLEAKNAAEKKLSDATEQYEQAMLNVPEGETPPVKPTEENQWTAEYIAELAGAIPFPIDNEVLLNVLQMPATQLTLIESRALSLLKSALNNGIKESFLEQELGKIETELDVIDNNHILTQVNGTILKTYTEPSQIYDKEATEKKREQAAEAVEPVVYKKGQNIVMEGDIVHQNQYEMVKELGLLKSKSFDLPLYGGMALFTLMLYGTLYLYALHFERSMFARIKYSLILNIIIVMVIGLSYLMRFFLPEPLIPVVMGAMLIAVLLRRFQLALIANFLIAALSGMAATGTYTLSTEILQICLTAVTGGTIAVLLLRKPRQRSALIGASTVVGVVEAVTWVAFGLMVTNKYKEILIDALWGFGGGILAGVLVLGTLTIWENAFNITTPMKLLELADPNQPLLKRLLVEAPGTYHHSIIVGNLAEEAADTIGADGLLARVGANYHDVGKLTHPYMFAENQMGEDNPHDHMAPELSAAVITAHPIDGVELAQQYKLPRRVLDIIQEHHGDTPVQYFYHKAVQMYGEDKVNLEDYRYPGPKPKSPEAAVIMLADTVEAALRSMKDHSHEVMQERIRQLIRSKLDDGQLNECALTLKDLDEIADAFMRVSGGIFHERVEYPSVDLAAMRKQRQEAIMQHHAKSK